MTTRRVLLDAAAVAALVVGLLFHERISRNELGERLMEQLPEDPPPAFTITSQLIMGFFAGLLGVTLATPLAAALVVVVTMLYVQDVLGRHDIRVRSH